VIRSNPTRAPALTVAITVIVLTLAAVQGVISLPMPGSPPAEPAASFASHGQPESDLAAASQRNAGRRLAAGWVGGLAVRLIHPFEISQRLARQDAEVAAGVTAAWAELEPIRGDREAVQTAVGWLRGLAAGYIITSDLHRLRQQQLELAEIVAAAWRHLRAL
jgi:hypothetical protein